jgi:hypothetical protein
MASVRMTVPISGEVVSYISGHVVGRPANPVVFLAHEQIATIAGLTQPSNVVVTTRIIGDFDLTNDCVVIEVECSDASYISSLGSWASGKSVSTMRTAAGNPSLTKP